jgi:hypothetical protein
MRHFGPVLAVLALAATPALAQQDWVSGEAFETWTRGRVVRADFADGALFGYEYFNPDGSVVWQNEVEGTCLTGVWRAEGGSICYHYDGLAEPSCLRYVAQGPELIGYQWENARGDDGFLGFVVRLSRTAKPPLSCDVSPLS